MWASILALLAVPAAAQVIPTGPNGPTNPDKPEFYNVGETVNQKSLSRLISINAIDDFCMYAPMEPGPDSTIGNHEHDLVAWCTKPRNGARLIPDGTIQAAQLVRTPAYIQIAGWWDGTKLNIPHGDNGGELDPHGATGEGNPVGGNVTTNLQGKQGDTFYEEWMMFISYDQFCARICTAEVNGVPVAKQCDHIYDLMGCQWVMAVDDNDYYNMNKFESCEGDIAAAPGVYGQSTFYQGQKPTPSAPAFYPKKSNCHTWDTIANGVGGDMKVTASPTLFQNQKCPTGK